MTRMGFGADDVCGDGMFKLQRALHALEKESELLGDARTRFDIPPPAYISDTSGTTTGSHTPAPLTEEQRRYRVRRHRVFQEHRASLPYSQFSQQLCEEQERAVNANSDGTYRLRVGENYQEIAHNNVRERWVAQGLWNDKWTQPFLGLWKHEEPLELESETELDPDAPQPPLFSYKPKPRRLKSEDERRRIQERLDIRRREREASRPYHQFIYQMSEERKRIQEESSNDRDIYAEDINTKVYEAVKGIWQERMIWNDEWGVIPGMAWKHEYDVDQELAKLYRQYRTASRAVPDTAPSAAPPIQIFESTVSDHLEGDILVSSSSPTHSNSAVTLDTLSGDLQSRDPNADAKPTDGNAQTSALVPRSLQPKSNQSCTTRRVTRATKQKSHPKDEQLHSLVALSQSPISKVSKPSTQRKPVRRLRSVVSQQVIQDALALSSHKDVTTSKRQRKSTRAREPKPISNERIKKDVPRRQRKVVSDNSQAKSSAKPQGVAKRRSPRNLAARARKWHLGK